MILNRVQTEALSFMNSILSFLFTNQLIKLKQKNLSVEKERSIDSKAQKKTNKITKFRINAFL